MIDQRTAACTDDRITCPCTESCLHARGLAMAAVIALSALGAWTVCTWIARLLP